MTLKLTLAEPPIDPAFRSLMLRSMPPAPAEMLVAVTLMVASETMLAVPLLILANKSPDRLPVFTLIAAFPPMLPPLPGGAVAVVRVVNGGIEFPTNG